MSDTLSVYLNERSHSMVYGRNGAQKRKTFTFLPMFSQFLMTVFVLLLAASYQECRIWLTGQGNMSTKVWEQTYSSSFPNFHIFHCRFLYFTCLVLIKFMNAPFFRQNVTKLVNITHYSYSTRPWCDCLFFDVVPCFVLCFLNACFVVENVNIFEFVGFKFNGENLIIKAFYWFSVIIQHHLVLLKQFYSKTKTLLAQMLVYTHHRQT